MKVSDYYVKWKYTGKITTCIILKEQDLVSVSNTVCGDSDTYNKEIGRKIALTRAIRNANLPKELRTKFWETYRIMTKIPRW